MDRRKEHYRIWLEYLKRSDKFKEFYDWYGEYRKNSNQQIPEKYRGKNDIKFNPSAQRFLDIYMRLLNLYAYKFYEPSFNIDEWWEHMKSRLIKTGELQRKEPIRAYSDIVEHEINKCIDAFKDANDGQEPTLKEFKTVYINNIKSDIPFWHLISIDLVNLKTAQITKAFRDYVRNKKKDPVVKSYEYFTKLNFIPQSTVWIDELLHYLKIYDLYYQKDKNGDNIYTMKEIIKKIGSQAHKKKYNDGNVIRLYRLQLDKAKKIIKNVEKGYFPGNYR